ncbi:MAG: hypothetical protein MAG581_02349 [Deltaproteobacteria bacterium]|nr:hypothetical protein [Deltaproteobacteria bacterium]
MMNKLFNTEFFGITGFLHILHGKLYPYYKFPMFEFIYRDSKTIR